MNDVIEALKAAEDNETLERLGKDFLQIDIDKRKKPETNRAILIAAVEQLSQGALEPEADSLASDTLNLTDGESPINPAIRLLHNTNTGRLIAYTDALAKLPHLVEEEA